jgi:hypothetical protein
LQIRNTLKSRCTTGINNTGGNDTGGSCINDTGSKFATGIAGSLLLVDTSGNFATDTNDTGGKQCEQYQTAYTLK